MPLTLYGLRNCDTCKKAMKALDDAGRDVTFVDIRAEADLGDRLPVWLETIDAKTLLNTRSTTWRGLSDTEKAEAEGGGLVPLLKAYPALIKRPVIEADGVVFIGWNKEVQLALSSL